MQTGGVKCILCFPVLSAASFPGCCCVFPGCSPLGQQQVLEEVKCVLKLVYVFIYFVLTSSRFLWLQTDCHMAVYLSCRFFFIIYIWSIFPLKLFRRVCLVGFVCLFLHLFLIEALYISWSWWILLLFHFPSHPWWHKTTFFWIIVFFVF